METPVDERIVEFIRQHHILTLATSFDNRPWCATCYYAYLREQNVFIITSDPETRHIGDFLNEGSGRVACAIALETRLVGMIRGVQITGQMEAADGDWLTLARKAYLKRFPVARLATLHLWIIRPDLIKMTDNRLGFGKKLYWPAQPA